ncbi:hypothetical protein [Corynebacterium callunae]|uniref:hypothetical protein n=1 Tax=Corynebacterium callunae TaxID=1721 RepID=UPI001FFF1DF2|nr:hypothetical protein [Corynebacterium callunae]MCK2199657.1 hypothetical protein [Corynebacterium callunae]
MPTDPTSGSDNEKKNDGWSELQLSNARIAAEALQPVLTEFQNTVRSALTGFPSFTAQLADTMRAVEIPKVEISNELKDSLRTIGAITPPTLEGIPNLLRNLTVDIPPIVIHFPTIDPKLLNGLRDTARMHDTWMEDLQVRLAPMATGLRRALLPPNLRQLVDEITAGEVNGFVEKEAIPLYLIPRSRTALRLIRANGRQARRKVLNSCFDSIIDDCEKVLTESHAEIVSDQVNFVLDGIGAMRAGYVHSAQALFTVTLDTLITRLYPDQETLHLVKRRNKDTVAPEEFDEMDIREALVWLPIWNAHEEFWPKNGDPVPHHFSRHASVHAVTSRQFNKRNCIQALMLVTSLVGYGNDRW